MQYLMNVFPQNAKKMSMLTKIRIQGIHYVVQNEKKNQDCTCSKNMAHVSNLFAYLYVFDFIISFLILSYYSSERLKV